MANIMKRNHHGSGGLTTARPAMPFSGWVDDILEKTLNRFFDDDLWNADNTPAQGQVPVNIRETDKSYEMEFMAPGLKKEDFNVQVSDNMLTVSFEHREEDKQENTKEGYLRQEYRMQSFSRSFTLDKTVDADKISASYNNGVLHVSLPKNEEALQVARKIEIS